MRNKNKRKTELGNKCGHDKARFRHCDQVSRKGTKTPPVIARAVALLNRAAHDRSMLRSWHTINDTRRRSEIREAMQATTQFLLLHWCRLDSQTCGDLREDVLVVPDARQIAQQISKSPEWAGKPRMSVWRVRQVLREFERCGYIGRSKQRKLQRANGRWESGPPAISFRKKFFQELYYGKGALWQAVLKERRRRLDPIIKTFGPVSDLPRAIAKYFRPRFIRSQRQIERHPNPTPPLQLRVA